MQVNTSLAKTTQAHITEGPKRPTDDEIRAKIAEFQASVEEEEANGGAGGDDWMEAATARHWLKWVLGE